MLVIDDIIKSASDFADISPLNYIPDLENMRLFDAPLMGVANADNPMFSSLKNPEIVGPHHLLPADWLPSAASVVSYLLPFTLQVRTSNRDQGLPSIEWLYGRIEGEQFNQALMRFISEMLISNSFQAVAPALDSRLSLTEMRSNWSERHVAFTAGLGTFSLNCSLITQRGAAGRFGSIVTDLKLNPTPAAYTGFMENCSRCGLCIKRCPPGAIDENGKNHQICSDYLTKMVIRFNPRYGCGKCQTGVPCEACIPERDK